jgi:hypothetical protein
MRHHLARTFLRLGIAAVAGTACVLWFSSSSGTIGPALQADDDPLAYQKEKAAGLHPIFRDGKWGYMDVHGRVVITPRFDSAMDFFENRAAVEISKPQKAGFIGPDGSWSTLVPRHGVPFGRFSEGRGWFLQAGFYGCVDRDGNVRIPPKYQSAREFSDGLARVGLAQPAPLRKAASKKGSPEKKWIWKYGFVDRSGKEVVPLQYAYAEPFGDSLAQTSRPGTSDYDFIDRAGNVVFSLARSSPGSAHRMGLATSFSSGRASAYFDGPSTFVRFFDKRGRQIGPDAPYRWAGRFSEGLAHACNLENKFGFVNTDARLVIPAAFENAGDFHEGRARVRVQGAWQYIDTRGAIVAKAAGSALWNDAEDFHEGLARVHVGGRFNESDDHGPRWWTGGNWYYVDRSGATVTVCRADGEDRIEPPLGHESWDGKYRLYGDP